jgi:hypothetical protein
MLVGTHSTEFVDHLLLTAELGREIFNVALTCDSESLLCCTLLLDAFSSILRFDSHGLDRNELHRDTTISNAPTKNTRIKIACRQRFQDDRRKSEERGKRSKKMRP